MNPGALIVIGVFTIVVGLSSVSVLCLASGALCVGLGIHGLIEESKTQSEDEDEDERID